MRGTGYVSAPDLSADLSVSERTIRRDLQKLADLGHAELVHGGAYAPGGVIPGARTHAHSDRKRAIARRALEFVEYGATIGVDSGTTTLELVRQLPADADLTVVTHSLPAMAALGERRDITLIGLGGLHHRSAQSFAGPDTVAAISRLRVHTFFLAASGVSPDGTYCGSPLAAEVKQAFIGIAERVILLADSTKPGRTAPVPICGHDRIDAIVTDDAIAEADRAYLAAVTRLIF
jgi:DeoR/GlpR family transcriptional regulator of sugar metabolism